MKSKLLLSLVFLFALTSAFAASDSGHHPSIFDLKWNMVNFLLFLGIILWAIRKPLETFFKTSAEFIQEKCDYSELKDKEARIKLEMYREKNDKILLEIEKVKKEAKEEVNSYQKTVEGETDETIARMHRDNENKLNYERDMMIRDINSSLVDRIVNGAKDKVKGDLKLQKEVSDKLISKII